MHTEFFVEEISFDSGDFNDFQTFQNLDQDVVTLDSSNTFGNTLGNAGSDSNEADDESTESQDGGEQDDGE